MDIVDRVRRVKAQKLAAPPFISGPCGLLPNTKVYVSAQVHIEGPSSARGVTVFVRPYQTSPGNLALLTCSLRNRPEALPEILSSIARTGVNIVNAVSAEVPDKGEVEVGLVLDWSNSPIRDRGASTKKQLKKYRDYLSILPVHAARYVELFENIYGACRSMFVRTLNGMPRLVIEEMVDPSGLQFFDSVTVETRWADTPGFVERRKDRNAYPVALIRLPAGLVAKLKLCLDVDDIDTLRYTLAADVRTRTLRAFFPEPTTSRSFVHLGFFHTDAPGTFAMILRPLGLGGIHIMNNLVRTLGNSETVLEAVLSIPNDLIPDRLRAGCGRDANTAIPACADLCSWIGEWMVEHTAPADQNLFTKCNLRVGRPLFPSPSTGQGQTAQVAVVDLIEKGVRLGSKLQATALNGSSTPVDAERRSIAERVRELVQARLVTGISVDGIREELESSGLAIKPTYLTSLLSRDTKGGKLRYAAGRYYPT